MRAWVLHDTEGPGSYRLEDVPTPEPGPMDVRVRLRVSALNRLDLWTSMGLPAPKAFPHVTGADGAGIVDAVGEMVSTVSVGDEVVVNPSISCGVCEACLRGESVYCPSYGILGEHRWGTFAEQVVVPAINVVPKPASLSWEEAGAYALAGGTAYRMLSRARLKTGNVLLVVGVGGGVASFGLGFGVAMGADVYVTSRSDAKIARAIELGAKAGFDSTGEFAAELKTAAGRPADVVFETVGPATWRQTIRALGPGGRLVICGSTSGPKVEITVPVLFFKQLEIIGSTMYTHGEFAEVTRLVASGRVPVLIDQVYGFDDLPAALTRMEAGEHLGKLVLRHDGTA